ncbi:hypothetical protein ACIBCT_05515 [Streptosporangium sp. NPDC050855]|uniref:hypothetical protein n=1 Tax=Streptosporangium sp. NPDC050855 TaxID=3366194 RepID=UPI00378F9976
MSATREAEEGGVLAVLDVQSRSDEHGGDQCLTREMPLLAPVSDCGRAQVQRLGKVDVQWLSVAVTTGLPLFHMLRASRRLLHVPEEAVEELRNRVIFLARCPISSDHASFDSLVLYGQVRTFHVHRIVSRLLAASSAERVRPLPANAIAFAMQLRSARSRALPFAFELFFEEGLYGSGRAMISFLGKPVGRRSVEWSGPRG